MNLLSHFHVIDKCCHGDFRFFFLLQMPHVIMQAMDCAQWYPVHGAAINMSLYIYHDKCLSE